MAFLSNNSDPKTWGIGAYLIMEVEKSDNLIAYDTSQLGRGYFPLKATKPTSVLVFKNQLMDQRHNFEVFDEKFREGFHRERLKRGGPQVWPQTLFFRSTFLR